MGARSPSRLSGHAPPSPPRLRVLSLGAGVQSTTLALMAAHGEIGPLDEVDLRTPEDLGQRDLFGNECEGLCGV